jgi:hypothetical protein
MSFRIFFNMQSQNEFQKLALGKMKDFLLLGGYQWNIL